jgi:hypothetical protein
MTVRQDDDGVIVLAGECPVEDAEALLERLQAKPDATVDWSACARLHTAVIQVLMAAGARLRGPCGDAFVRDWLCLQPRRAEEQRQRR